MEKQETVKKQGALKDADDEVNFDLQVPDDGAWGCHTEGVTKEGSVQYDFTNKKALEYIASALVRRIGLLSYVAAKHTRLFGRGIISNELDPEEEAQLKKDDPDNNCSHYTMLEANFVNEIIPKYESLIWQLRECFESLWFLIHEKPSESHFLESEDGDIVICYGWDSLTIRINDGETPWQCVAVFNWHTPDGMCSGGDRSILVVQTGSEPYDLGGKAVLG